MFATFEFNQRSATEVVKPLASFAIAFALFCSSAAIAHSQDADRVRSSATIELDSNSLRGGGDAEASSTKRLTPSDNAGQNANEDTVTGRLSLDQEDENNALLETTSSRAFSTETRGLRINIVEQSADAPTDRSAELSQSSPQPWDVLPAEKVFAWAAPNIRYQPLYFEDVALERYGQTPCGIRQTMLSGLHFFSSAALLSSQMNERHPCDCDWPLGFCRPGSNTPFVWQKPLAH